MQHGDSKVEKPIHIKKGDTETIITPTTELQGATSMAVGSIVEGEMPSNKDLDRIGGYLEDLLKDIEGEPRVETFASDAESLLHDTLKLFHDKNRDEVLQEAVAELKGAAEVEGGRDLSKYAKVMRDSMQRTAPRLVKFVNRLVVDPEFRTYLQDVLDFFQGKSVEIADDVRENEEKDVVQAVKEAYKEGDEETEQMRKRSIEFFHHLRKNEEYKPLMKMMFKTLDDLDLMVNMATKEIESMGDESRSAVDKLKTFLERLSHSSLDPLIDTWTDLLRSKDDEIFYSLRENMRALMIDPHGEYSEREAFERKFEEIEGQVKEINTSYDELLTQAFTKVVDLLNSIGDDPQVLRLSEDWKNMVRNLFYEDGTVSAFAALESVKVLNQTVISLFRNQVEWMQFPDIKMVSPKYDFELTDWELSPLDLLPDSFHIETNTNLDISLVKESKEDFKAFDGVTDVKISFSPLTINIEDLSFRYKKKKFIKFADAGRVNFTSTGSIDLNFRFTLEKGQLRVEYKETSVSLENFQLDILSAKKQALDKVFYGIFKPLIRSRIESLLEETHTSIGTSICQTINKFLAGQSPQEITPPPEEQVQITVE